MATNANEAPEPAAKTTPPASGDSPPDAQPRFLRDREGASSDELRGSRGRRTST
jgi:hypothetical protein